MDKLRLEDIMTIHEQHEEARKDDTPYAVQSLDGSISVVGDANKTESKQPLTFTIDFRFHKAEMPNVPINAKKVGNFVIVTRTFENVFINGRNDMYLMESIMGIYPLIKVFDEVKEERNKSIQELNEKYGVNIDLDLFVPKQGELKKEIQEELDELLYTFNFKFIQAFNSVGEMAQDAIYSFVAKLLKIDKTLEDHMTGASVMSVITKIINEYPELFNEAETVFTL